MPPPDHLDELVAPTPGHVGKNGAPVRERVGLRGNGCGHVLLYTGEMYVCHGGEWNIKNGGMSRTCELDFNRSPCPLFR
jgi:hypothetical protein